LIEDFSIVCFPYVPEEKDYNITADVVRQVRGEKDHLGPVQIKHARAVTKKRPNQLGAWAGSKNMFVSFKGLVAVFTVGFRERTDVSTIEHCPGVETAMMQ